MGEAVPSGSFRGATLLQEGKEPVEMLCHGRSR